MGDLLRKNVLKYFRRMIVNLGKLLAVSVVSVIFQSCDGNSNKVASSAEEIKALPLIEMSSPKDGELIAEGTSVPVKYSLPEGVKDVDSTVISFNGKVVSRGTEPAVVIQTAGLKMGRQEIKIEAYKGGAVAAEKYSSISIKSANKPTQYTYNVLKTYPHDTRAYTQGLTFDNNILYEGTGQKGESELRIVDLKSGAVQKSLQLPSDIFGEGIAILGDKIFQLSWQEQRGFVYDKRSFEKLREFMYPCEGWGLTTDGTVLFLSDGTNVIRVFDPEKLIEISRIEVYDDKSSVAYLNELEYINGEIWANIYMTDNIARIDPKTGQVLGYIDFKGLLPKADYGPDTDVLNGIAYNSHTGQLFVTGKKWPKLFEIKVQKK